MDFTKWAYHPSRVPLNKKEREQFLDGLEEQFYADLKADPKVLEYLQQFRYYPRNESDFDKFLRDHAHAKRIVLDAAEAYIEIVEAVPELGYPDQCAACLDAIQHKKLFDLECRWRANEIRLPGVDICWDFRYWGYNIRHCTFLPPVIETEVKLMQEFLATDEGADWVRYEKPGYLRRMADYDSIHSERDLLGRPVEYPQWFAFWDDYFGSSPLHLPDLRTPLEEHYQQAAFEEPAAPAPVVSPTADDRPFLHFYWSGSGAEFTKVIEDPYFKSLMSAHFEWLEQQQEARGDYEPVEDARMLLKLRNPVPMPAHDDWREALHWCHLRTVARDIAAELETAFKEYQFYRQTGLQTGEIYTKWDKMIAEMKQQILDGREACGEPRDFNF